MTDDERGRAFDPKTVVLGDGSPIPPGNLVLPPPTHFTHRLTADEPYRFEHPDRPHPEPDGSLPAGERVLMAIPGRERCRVITGAGLYVDVRSAVLRALR